MRFSFVVIAGLLLGFSFAACGSDGPDSSPMPDGIKVEVDQSRYQQSGRTLFVSIQNGTDQQITISDFTLSSPRFDDVDWSGDDVLEAGQKTDIDFTMPRGRCGTDLDASIAVTYQVDGGRPQISTTTVDDLYDHALYFADRDCTQLTFEEAAKVEIGQPQVSGAGRSSVLSLPVTLTPTGEREDVRFVGFGDTVLFRQAAGSPVDVDLPLTGAPRTVTMQVVPARCDPHALAEDKVGRMFPVKIEADDLPADAAYFLPLDKGQKTAFFDFFRSHCAIS